MNGRNIINRFEQFILEKASRRHVYENLNGWVVILNIISSVNDRITAKYVEKKNVFFGIEKAEK